MAARATSIGGGRRESGRAAGSSESVEVQDRELRIVYYGWPRSATDLAARADVGVEVARALHQEERGSGSRPRTSV
jgi:hypothetical protein